MVNWFNIFGWVLTILTAAGNGFVVFFVAKNRRLHASANWFVLSLALADFAIGIVVFPSGYFCHTLQLPCNFRVYTASFWFFINSSVANLCVLTWDRYSAIVHPLRYNNSITVRRPGLVIMIAWLVPCAISLSLLVGMYATESDTALKILRLTGVSAFDIISCVLLFYAVVRILVVARAQSRQDAAMELQVFQSSHSSSSSSTAPSCRRRKRSTSAPFIIAIVLFFLGCHSVVNYFVLCIAFSCQVPVEPENAGQIINILLVLNSTVNPLVYAFLKKDIKKEVKKLICRG